MGRINETPWEKVAREASERGLWIYDPTYKRWYTPEEFLHTFGNIKSYDAQFYKNIEYRNPVDGISAAFKQIEGIQERLKVFAEKVAKYYQVKK